MTSLLKRLDSKAELFPHHYPSNTICPSPYTGWHQEWTLYFAISSVNNLHFQGSTRQSRLNQNFNFSTTSGGSFSFYPSGLGPSLAICIGKNSAFSFTLLFLSLALCSFFSLHGCGQGKGNERTGQSVMLWLELLRLASQAPKCGFLPLLWVLLRPCSGGCPGTALLCWGIWTQGDRSRPLAAASPRSSV